ncbi:prolyl oligopeptidase family protein, partial [Acinetobacter sp. 1396970]
MKNVKIKAPYWEIAANLYFPENFDESIQYPAIISGHPIGSCKEQTSGNVYGAALAKAGFIVIAFDASFQGESGGEPRSIENPVLRVEDFRLVTDYLMTLNYVDENRIGVLGICGGGGYALNVAMTEKRIKSVATVDAINFGRLSREG